MAKKEVKTDLWVASQLDKCKIQFTAQGSDVKEIDEALSTASKRGTGNAGYPEYVAVIYISIKQLIYNKISAEQIKDGFWFRFFPGYRLWLSEVK